jgi:hypothetical protein
VPKLLLVVGAERSFEKSLKPVWFHMHSNLDEVSLTTSVLAWLSSEKRGMTHAPPSLCRATRWFASDLLSGETFLPARSRCHFIRSFFFRMNGSHRTHAQIREQLGIIITSRQGCCEEFAADKN